MEQREMLLEAIGEDMRIEALLRDIEFSHDDAIEVVEQVIATVWYNL